MVIEEDPAGVGLIELALIDKLINAVVELVRDKMEPFVLFNIINIIIMIIMML
jgi:hypothetical protein